MGTGSGNIEGHVVAMPNVLKSPGIPMVFEINSAQTYTLSVNLYDIAGELVRKLSHSSQANEVDGPTEGLASGLYVAVVTLNDSQGLFVGRQVLKVVIVH
jgi:hypothetical protein